MRQSAFRSKRQRSLSMTPSQARDPRNGRLPPMVICSTSDRRNHPLHRTTRTGATKVHVNALLHEETKAHVTALLYGVTKAHMNAHPRGEKASATTKDLARNVQSKYPRNESSHDWGTQLLYRKVVDSPTGEKSIWQRENPTDTRTWDGCQKVSRDYTIVQQSCTTLGD